MMAKLNFQHHYSSLQRHMIFQKSFYHAESGLKKHFILLSVLKIVVFKVFLFLLIGTKVEKKAFILSFAVVESN